MTTESDRLSGKKVEQVDFSQRDPDRVTKNGTIQGELLMPIRGINFKLSHFKGGYVYSQASLLRGIFGVDLGAVTFRWVNPCSLIRKFVRQAFCIMLPVEKICIGSGAA